MARWSILYYYLYGWRRFRSILLQGLLVNYLLPSVAEFLPWYLSRRKLGQRLRRQRTAIEHSLIAEGIYSKAALFSYFVDAIIFGIMCAIDTYMRVHISDQARALIERQMIERIMSSDVQAISTIYKRVYGIEIYTKSHLIHKHLKDDLESLSRTANITLPSIIRSLITFSRSAWDLYDRRHQIDPLAVIRPTIIALSIDIYSRLQQRLFPVPVADSQSHDVLIADLLDRLPEIQSANLQAHQLAQLDNMIASRYPIKDAAAQIVDYLSKAIGGHSVIEFTTEVIMAKRVMVRAKIDHETYRKVQNDVDYCLRLLYKMVLLVREARDGLAQSSGLIALLALKPFKSQRSPSSKKRPPLEFNRLDIRDVRYQYSSTGCRALQISTPVSFTKGKFYCLVGPNGAGKSTLIQVLMKLLPPGPGSRVSVDGVPLSSIDKTHYRHHIAYVSQRPYLFPGTIADNIRVGHPDATLEQVEAAAQAAGVFLSDLPYISQDASSDQVSDPLPVLADLVALATSFTEAPSSASESSASNPFLFRSIYSLPLSGGTSQSIALSRVFLSENHVRLLILDEGLAMMDSAKKHTFILPRLLAFVQQHNMTLIMVSHDPSVFNQADHIVIMESGRVIEQGAPNDLYARRSPAYLRLSGVNAWAAQNFKPVVESL